VLTGPRTAEKGDELAPLHSITSSAGRQAGAASAFRASDGKDSTPSAPQETAALRNFNPVYVGSGSFSSDRHPPDARGMSASPPIASELWHRSESTRSARSGPAGIRCQSAHWNPMRWLRDGSQSCELAAVNCIYRIGLDGDSKHMR